MATVDEVVTSALSAVKSQAGLLLGKQWLNARYRQLVRRVRFKHRRRLGAIVIPAKVNAGLATTTRGSNVVTGDATAQAVWTSDLIGRYFRASETWYRIDGITPGQDELRIFPTFGETAIAAGAYNIVARFFDLPRDVRWLGTFSHMRTRRWFKLTPPEILDQGAPDRTDISDGPRFATDFGQGTDGGKRIELYPFSTDEEVLHYSYWDLPVKLELGDELPSVIDGDVMKEGILIDVMRWNSGKAIESKLANPVEAAAYWRNEYRAQETRWEKFIKEAIMADRGQDDTTLQWVSARNLGGPNVVDIVNAEQHVWSTSIPLL